MAEMTDFERGQRDILDKMVGKINELGSTCPKCDEGDEEEFNWCDIHCMATNFFLDVLHQCGYGLKGEELVKR